MLQEATDPGQAGGVPALFLLVAVCGRHVFFFTLCAVVVFRCFFKARF